MTLPMLIDDPDARPFEVRARARRFLRRAGRATVAGAATIAGRARTWKVQRLIPAITGITAVSAGTGLVFAGISGTCGAGAGLLVFGFLALRIDNRIDL